MFDFLLHFVCLSFGTTLPASDPRLAPSSRLRKGPQSPALCTQVLVFAAIDSKAN